MRVPSDYLLGSLNRSFYESPMHGSLGGSIDESPKLYCLVLSVLMRVPGNLFCLVLSILMRVPSFIV